MDTTELVVRQMRWESQDVMSVRLEKSDGAALAAWTPGAHIDIHLGPTLIRQYSLCGDPDDKTGYRIAVLRDPASRGGSEHVHEMLRPGQLVSVSEPRNNFELIDSPHFLFIAGGIGITPILAMIREVSRRGASWELHYGGRSKSGMAFLDEIAEFQGSVEIVCEDESGRLNLTELLSVPRAGTAVYTCGPEGLLEAVESHGAEWPDGAIQLERFKPKVADPADSGGDRAVRVVCSRSGISAVASPDRSILDTLEDAGIDVSNSCREGMCGSCETPVLEGIPDHRDSVLSAAEQSSGKTMMICVSRARTDELVLDL
ncbi:PDR/VanB family oxidoreductase [Rhodococcus sp. APC 3903]|uniref:PDR/VanB family oxidoreductase n=1 Tax=Rhodococcus sp. APC 3903 TaxID=3035193 RepID=UPI0025B5BEFB|nr:PDR/VanB family oxidoreductase [Rhodococcus sp. APC 3903]MDN3460779.1 PDR/VanB family oxidoreductase [Rhodococcus sp. APC 3903]